MKTTVIIPIWNRADVVKPCLESFRANTKQEDLCIIAVDNNSDGKTKKLLKTMQGFMKNLIVITNPKNMGYLGGINTGLQYMQNKKMESDYVVFGNSDTEVEAEWLPTMEKWFNTTPMLGALGPVSNTVSGLQHVQYNDRFGEKLHITDKYLIGFFMMIPYEIIQEIGLLDARFGLGFSEDIDYSLRLKEAGYKLGIARDVYVKHVGSASYELLHNAQQYQDDLDKKHKLLVEKWGAEKVFETIECQVYNGTIAYSGGEMVPTEFVECFLHLLNNTEHWIYQFGMKNNFLPRAWTEGLERMQGDWVLLIDTNAMFAHTVLDEILAMKKDAVVFTYPGTKDISALFLKRSVLEKMAAPYVMYDKEGIAHYLEEQIKKTGATPSLINDHFFDRRTSPEKMPVHPTHPQAFGTIGIPMMEHAHYEFVVSIASVLIKKKEQMELIITKCMDISDARNHIAENRKGNWVWFIDSDHIFAPDMLNRLRARQLPICTAIAFQKAPPYMPCIYAEHNGDGKNHAILFPWVMDRPFEIGMTGTGCVLINDKVFQAIEHPYFEYNADMGEDMYFFTKAKKAGFPIVADPTIPIGHMTSQPVDFDLFIATNYPQYKVGKSRV